jgi:ABC-2 type transport system ATP-binding protein
MHHRGLEIDGVSKRYGTVVALQDMTFEVGPGELFGFVGSNGAGKTTTMRIALGVLAADAGEVRWGGQPVTLATRRRIGYMPEERGLYPRMKVAEQLVYLARLHGLTPRDAARSVDTWLERLGVAARRDDEVIKLSLGNQQRVQLAAALVHDPAILVLDEPFSGLDPVAVDVMSQVLREKCAIGVPAVFSSHQLDLVERLCDRVGIVRAGHMVACGAIDELRAGATEQLVVHAPSASDGWAAGLPGVTVRGRDNGRTVLELAPGTDDQAVLRAALATGPVHEFARTRPSLTDLFRNVVTEHDDDDTTTRGRAA